MKKEIKDMKKNELRNECLRQMNLLKRAANHIAQIEAERDFYKGISKSADLYIIYLLDSLQEELGVKEGTEFSLNKEDLSSILKTKKLAWRESDDKSEVLLKIEDIKEVGIHESDLPGINTTKSEN